MQVEPQAWWLCNTLRRPGNVLGDDERIFPMSDHEHAPGESLRRHRALILRNARDLSSRRNQPVLPTTPLPLPPQPPTPTCSRPVGGHAAGGKACLRAMTVDATESPAALEGRGSGQNSPRWSSGYGLGQDCRWTLAY